MPLPSKDARASRLKAPYRYAARNGFVPKSTYRQEVNHWKFGISGFQQTHTFRAQEDADRHNEKKRTKASRSTTASHSPKLAYD